MKKPESSVDSNRDSKCDNGIGTDRVRKMEDPHHPHMVTPILMVPKDYKNKVVHVADEHPPSTESQASTIIRDKCRELILDNDKLKKIMEVFLDNVERGLKKKTHSTATVKCFPTYVQDLPNGTEHGKFLALDLGGTNFRVLLIELSGEHFEMKSKIFAIPQHIMLGSGEQLFDHIAECLAIFVKEEHVQDQMLPLGFTFSFPLSQKGLTVGILERWTKGFNCSNVIGNDVVQMLNEAIDRRGDVLIEVTAILNDTTGTLMSHRQ
nr:unnamed protein product [Callosobruchus chinensis]